jgi:hypothetical protein
MGKLPDVEVARRISRTVAAVRIKCERARVKNPTDK